MVEYSKGAQRTFLHVEKDPNFVLVGLLSNSSLGIIPNCWSNSKSNFKKIFYFFSFGLIL